MLDGNVWKIRTSNIGYFVHPETIAHRTESYFSEHRDNSIQKQFDYSTRGYAWVVVLSLQRQKVVLLMWCQVSAES